jgi:hypothetical protein
MSQIPFFAENTTMEQFSKAQKKELQLLMSFVKIYCRAKHRDRPMGKAEVIGLYGREPGLCGECAGLLEHALEKRRRCPLEPKPSCKNCHIHCYAREYRARIREVMSFSGRRMILRGRLDYLWHYLF